MMMSGSLVFSYLFAHAGNKEGKGRAWTRALGSLGFGAGGLGNHWRAWGLFVRHATGGAAIHFSRHHHNNECQTNCLDSTHARRSGGGNKAHVQRETFSIQ